jgi:diguanylate cyclase (GGDEF)-like protein
VDVTVDGRTAATGDGGILGNLVQLGQQLRTSPDLAGVVGTIATAASRTFGFEEITIYLRRPSDDVFRAFATVGRDQDLDDRILSTPVPGAVFDRLLDERYRTGCIYFRDHREYPWPPEFDQYLPSPDLGTRLDGEWHADDTLLVPLRDHDDRVVGVLDLSDPADRRLPTPQLARELEVFATYAAVAVDNARHYEELGRTTRELERQLGVRHDLHDLSGVLLSTLDHTAVFGQIADLLKELVDYDCIDISLVDEGAGELITIFAQDAYADEIMEFRVPLSEGVSGWVVRHRQAQLINDMYADSRVVRVPGTEEEPQASILVPLVFMDVCLGVLIIDRLHERIFEQHELETVQLFANLAAIAIRNAATYKEMEVQASTDGLTGLFNHRHFQESLAVEVARGERYASGFCLLMMDLDRFKVVNDTVGHQRGDDVLRGVAGVLRRCSRESDVVARYGGEEFAMILPHTSVDEALQVAERIRSLVAELPAGDPSLQMTISVGVASFPEAARDKDGVIGAADAALLCAKARGRNRVCTAGETSPERDYVVLQEGPLTSLGYRFGMQAGLTEEEATALAAALHVVESGARAGRELSAVASAGDGGSGADGNGSGASPVYGRLFEAILYGTERWDGRGYPEGLHGDAIPRVARAFAVLRSFAEVNGGSIDTVRLRSGKQLDPRLVNRFMAFLADEARQWSPLTGAGGGQKGA